MTTTGACAREATLVHARKKCQQTGNGCKCPVHALCSQPAARVHVMTPQGDALTSLGSSGVGPPRERCGASSLPPLLLLHGASRGAHTCTTIRVHAPIRAPRARRKPAEEPLRVHVVEPTEAAPNLDRSSEPLDWRAASCSDGRKASWEVESSRSACALRYFPHAHAWRISLKFIFCVTVMLSKMQIFDASW